MIRAFKAFERGGPLKKLRESLPQAVENAGREAGRIVAAGLEDEVRNRIPNLGGWLTLYRDALTNLENGDGNEFAVAGISDIKLTDVPAEFTLVTFEPGRSGTVAALIRHQPWTIDAIPHVVGGIPGDAVVKPASEGEVSATRERLAGEMATILAELAEAGASVQQHERPIINGQVIADLAFLGKRLEHGLGGFRRSPHWLPAVAKARNSASAWIKAEKARIAAVLKGGDGDPASESMSDSMQAELDKKRGQTWR